LRFGEFFANKEELYKALVLEKSKEFHSTLLNALGKGRDEMACIRAYLEAHIRVFMDNLKFVRLYLAETRGARFNIGAGLDEELEKIWIQEKLVDLTSYLQTFYAVSSFSSCSFSNI